MMAGEKLTERGGGCGGRGGREVDADCRKRAGKGGWGGGGWNEGGTLGAVLILMCGANRALILMSV
jgi:hypothetical protein